MQLNEFLQITGLTLKIGTINNRYIIDFEENVVVSQNPLLKNSVEAISDSVENGLIKLTKSISNKTIYVNDSRRYDVPLLDLYRA